MFGNSSSSKYSRRAIFIKTISNIVSSFVEGPFGSDEPDSRRNSSVLFLSYLIWVSFFHRFLFSGLIFSSLPNGLQQLRQRQRSEHLRFCRRHLHLERRLFLALTQLSSFELWPHEQWISSFSHEEGAGGFEQRLQHLQCSLHSFCRFLHGHSEFLHDDLSGFRLQ